MCWKMKWAKTSINSKVMMSWEAVTHVIIFGAKHVIAWIKLNQA
jgi:hypothetical protein